MQKACLQIEGYEEVPEIGRKPRHVVSLPTDNVQS
jgi:hypothetical protein